MLRCNPKKKRGSFIPRFFANTMAVQLVLQSPLYFGGTTFALVTADDQRKWCRPGFASKPPSTGENLLWKELERCAFCQHSLHWSLPANWSYRPKSGPLKTR